MSAVLKAREPSARPASASQPRLLKHFELLASAPGGVAQLRELILTLAAQGKLVPQEAAKAFADPGAAQAPNANEWAGRSRRSDEGTGAHSADCELLPCKLPAGWRWVRLRDLGEFRGGKTPSTQQPRYWGGPIPWITPKDMKQLRLSDSEDRVTEVAVEDGLALIPPHSLLIVVRSGILRRTLPTAINEVATTVNQDLKALVFTHAGSAAYVQLMLRGFERYILANLTKFGTTVESIRFDAFSLQRFPMPSPEEQNRIVARVNDLMSLCDALEEKGRFEADQHKQLLNVLLDTLANSASPEELAANWQRVAAHFDLLLARPEAVDSLEAVAVRLAISGRLARQEECEFANRADKRLPAGWADMSIGELSSVVTDGTHKTPQYVAEGVKFVSAKDVRGGALKFDGCKYITREEHELLTKRCRPERGDILVSKSGSIGTVVRVEVDEEFSLFESLALIKFDQRKINGEFLRLAIQDACNSLGEADIKGVAVKHLHLNVLRRLRIALPPADEQARLVALVDQHRRLCSELREKLAVARKVQGRLAEALSQEAEATNA